MISGRNFFSVQESQTIFCPLHKVLENHDLGQTSQDLGKTTLPPKISWAGTPMKIRIYFRYDQSFLSMSRIQLPNNVHNLQYYLKL